MDAFLAALRGCEKIEIQVLLPIFFASFEKSPPSQTARTLYEGGDFRNLLKNIDKITRILIFSQPLRDAIFNGKLFISFSPAMSDKAKQNKRDEIKAWMKEVKPTGALKEFVEIVNPVVTGWINYYGQFCASELWDTMKYIDSNLIRWARKKYDKIRSSWRKGTKWLNGIKNREPTLFKHWQWMTRNDLDRRAV